MYLISEAHLDQKIATADVLGLRLDHKVHEKSYYVVDSLVVDIVIMLMLISIRPNGY